MLTGTAGVDFCVFSPEHAIGDVIGELLDLALRSDRAPLDLPSLRSSYPDLHHVFSHFAPPTRYSRTLVSSPWSHCEELEAQLLARFDPLLQDALLRRGGFASVEVRLADPGYATVVRAMVWFSKDVFVGPTLLGPAVGALISGRVMRLTGGDARAERWQRLRHSVERRALNPDGGISSQ